MIKALRMFNKINIYCRVLFAARIIIHRSPENETLEMHFDQ